LNITLFWFHSNRTPLHEAAVQGNKGLITTLLALGADPTKLDLDGKMPRYVMVTLDGKMPMYVMVTFRVGKNPGFFWKNPAQWLFLGFFGFYGFFLFFWGFFAQTRGFLGFFSVSQILLGASRL
jgi:hypothetical protein